MNKHITFTFSKDEFHLLEQYLISEEEVKTTVGIINYGYDWIKWKVSGSNNVLEEIDFTPGLGKVHVKGIWNPEYIYEDEITGMTLFQTFEYDSEGGYTVITQTLNIGVYWK